MGECFRPDTLTAIVAFCRKRYDNRRIRQPHLAAAHLLIINLAQDMSIGSSNAERRLFDFLGRHQGSTDLTKACKEVLKQLGSAP